MKLYGYQFGSTAVLLSINDVGQTRLFAGKGPGVAPAGGQNLEELPLSSIQDLERWPDSLLTNTVDATNALLNVIRLAIADTAK